MKKLKETGYSISTDKSLLDPEAIHDYLCNVSYWAKGRSMESVLRSIEHSLCYGVYYEYKQVGFARVITDYVTFAYLADVYILESHRGKGLSKDLMATIVIHPKLQGLRRFVLATRDAHSLYERYGFKALSKPERWMEIFKE
ncbi:MAG TPA: GNAT family N-acetyltransferase [Nitrosopumilaceae archaeon]|jgi:GNAT superfamily N-acetyltransferase|nr:GNAT family N-acetyltransferase [Nitrosopumilaceae archaeon]